MAIFSQSVQVISRGQGRSAVAAAAYRAGEKIQNQYDGAIHDYRPIHNRVAHSEIMLPEYAPREYADRAMLWNEVERKEKANNSRLSREVRIALPIELLREDNIQLAREYVQKQYVDNGMIADLNIHDSGDGNPHAHIMLTTRGIDNNGYWMDKEHKVYILDSNGNKRYDPVKKTYKCRTEKVNNWDSVEFHDEARERWAGCINEALKARGYDERVDHRSYEEQGIDKVPTIHMGAASSEMEKRGIVTERGEYNREVTKLNEAKEQYYGAVHNARVESPIYRQEQQSIQQLAEKLNRQDNIIDFCKTKMVEELNKAVAGRLPESARDEIVKTWRERIAYAEQEKTQAGQEITKTRITIFPEYGNSIAELEKAKIQIPQDEKAIQTLAARVDAAKKITFRELRDAANAYTQAQKEHASATYKLQFVPDDKVKGAIADIEASKAKMDACKAELMRVKTLFVMDEREAMQQAKTQGAERNAANSVPLQPEPVTMLSEEEIPAALRKRDWSLDELKRIPKADIKAAVDKVRSEYYALIVMREKTRSAVVEIQNQIKSQYSNLNMASATARAYKAMQWDLKEYGAQLASLQKKLNGMNAFERMAGNHFAVQNDIRSYEKLCEQTRTDIRSCANEFLKQYGIDITKVDADSWIDHEKRRFDAKYMPVKADRIAQNKAIEGRIKEKRLEMIEKIALAKDQRVFDAEGHSMREVMMESGNKPGYAARNDDILRKVSKKDQKEIAERKDRNNQPKEKAAIQNAVKAQQAVVKALQKGIEIGEDNAR